MFIGLRMPVLKKQISLKLVGILDLSTHSERSQASIEG